MPAPAVVELTVGEPAVVELVETTELVPSVVELTVGVIAVGEPVVTTELVPAVVELVETTCLGDCAENLRSKAA